MPVVDMFIGGAPFAVLENFTLYKLPKAVDRHSEPSTTWDVLEALLAERQPSHSANWVVVYYAPIGAAAVSHEAIFDTLEETFKEVRHCLCGGGVGQRPQSSPHPQEVLQSLPGL